MSFPYYGGKFSQLDTLIKKLPSGIEKMHYVEPFGGSMALLINKPKSKCETYNDIGFDVVNFFEVLRENRDELLEKLYLTPYSRSEYENAFISTDCKIELAKRFYIRIRMSMNAVGKYPSQFRISVKQNSPLTQRFRNSMGDLFFVSNRILDVHIENKCALEIIDRYDSENTFFYLDPPYMEKTRVDPYAYKNEFRMHIELSNKLNSIKGKFLLSGYGDYDLDLLCENEVSCASSPKLSKARRVEKLWCNYGLEKDEQCLMF